MILSQNPIFVTTPQLTDGILGILSGNLLYIVSQFFSRSAQAVFLLMEYCSGGDLFSQGSSNVGDNGEGHATGFSFILIL